WLLGPWGSGFLYVRHELVTELEPAFAGWMAFRGTDDFTRLTDYDPTFHEDARRFELITLPFQDMAGMTASLGLFEEVGIATVAEHLRALRIPLLEAAARGRFAVVSPTDPPHDCGIWCIQTADLRGTYRRLRAAGVVASLREGSIRFSPHFYTTLDDIARVIEVLDQ
ncbi:MAG: aminotransferase class V-fold PLP-dependent enzyme, partial [Gemmatimonadota bacterium]|nr:aminotransferase class V-fold PLP-dependent enzyme [Gemmatimonadota bacterium]